MPPSEPPPPFPVEPPRGQLTPTSSSGGCLQSLGMIGVGMVVLVTAVLGVVGGRYLMPSPPPATTVVNSGPPVVVAIKSLSRLETAQFHMERVIDLRRKQEALLGMIDTEDAILLVAAARVSAGVDLDKIDDEDVDVSDDRKRVTIRLPAPEIFESALDNDRTYVHTRETDFLADRAEGLETQARQEAEKQLREAAMQAGILKIARDNAKQTVTSLLRSLGFEQITVAFE